MVGFDRVIGHWSFYPFARSFADRQEHGPLLRAEWGSEYMPLIPPNLLNCVFFLYKTESQAKNGRKVGGTGFFVGIRSSVDQSRCHLLAVTNWHVAIRDKATILRVSKCCGSAGIIPTDPSRWIPHGPHDIAVLPIVIDESIYEVTSLSTTNMLLSKDNFDKYKIGVGEDVYMIGRFIDHDGGPANVPAVRFGAISIIAERDIKQATGCSTEGFCLDMHSRSGHSGSPVFVYRTNVHALNNVDYTYTASQFVQCLGIHCGQFPEVWKLRSSGKVRPDGATRKFIGEAEVQGLSGMTWISPAWRILELLNDPRITKWIAKEEVRLSEEIGQSVGIPE